MVYLSTIELKNQGDMSGLLNSPVDRKKPVLVFFDVSGQAVLNFYLGIDEERAAVNSHVMEAIGP